MLPLLRYVATPVLCLLCAASFADPPPLPFDQVPELKQQWEIPLETYGFVAFTPEGDKAVYVDKQAVTVFQPKTGKKTRQVPHKLGEPYGFSCSDSDLAAWTGHRFDRYRFSTAKIVAALRCSQIAGAEPRYSPDGNYLVCSTELGAQLFSTDSGEWGKPLAAVELDDVVGTAFLESGKKMLAIGKSGEFQIVDVPSGKPLSSGTLPSWPKSHELFKSRLDGLREISVRPSDNELYLADGKSILVYDLNIVPALTKTFRLSFEPRFIEAAAAAPVAIALRNLSFVQLRDPRGDVLAFAIDTRTGKPLGKFPTCNSCASIAISPDGKMALAVIGHTNAKNNQTKWSIHCWSTGFEDN